MKKIQFIVCFIISFSSYCQGNYTWTGSVSNNIYTEANWSNGTSTIPQINPSQQITNNLIINSGTAGATGYSGNLFLGGYSLTVNGGSITSNSTSGLSSYSSGSNKSPLILNGGNGSFKFILNINATISNGSKLTLTGANNPLNASTVNIISGTNAQLLFTNETPTDFTNEHLSKIRVDGQPAIIGTNIQLQAVSTGTLVTSIIQTNNYSFDHTDTDGDGVPNVVENNLNLDPNNPSSSLGKRPNIIFILVDDLGYGDLGKFFQDNSTNSQKFDTPNLDKMATEGLMLQHHYVSAPVCAPSRASFLEGLHQGHSTVRDNQFDKPLPDNLNIATLLRNSGYYTAVVGKHGLAGGRNSTLDGHPLKRGFDEFFGYLYHSEGHEHYPRNGTTDKNAFLHDGFNTITTNTDKVYTTDVFTAKSKEFIMRRKQSNPNQPFFLYLAYDVPHQKMQVPTMAYPAGKGVNGGLQWTGANGTPAYVNTNTGTIDSYLHPDIVNQSWVTSAKKHVGMIRRVDDCVDDILQTLKDLDIDKNTIVVFTSDNGPHHEKHDPRNFLSFGFLDGTKRDMWEGGIRVPAIVWWPSVVPSNTKSNLPSGIWDWMSTFADLGNVSIPALSDGFSLKNEIKNPGTQSRTNNLYFEYSNNSTTQNYTQFTASKRGRSRLQSQVIRIGDLKGIRTNIQSANDNFEIYNVLTDPKETTNLASSMTTMQQQMKNEVLRMRATNATAVRPYDNVMISAITTTDLLDTGLSYSYYNNRYLWVPDYSLIPGNATGTVSNIDLSVRQNNADFGLYFKGYINIPVSGTYTFYLDTDAAAHVKIHNIHILNDDINPTHAEKSYTMNLQAGLHPITISYKHKSEASYQLNLSFEGPSIIKQIIPDSFFKFKNNQTLKLTNKSEENTLSISPNPSNNIVSITTLDNIQKTGTLKVYNHAGALVLSVDKYKTNTDVNIKALANGLYVYNLITNQNNETFTGKFIKN